MKFERQDAITFGIGLGAALALAVGQALVQFDAAAVQDDPGPFLTGLATAAVTSLGRYLVTRVPEWLVTRGGAG